MNYNKLAGIASSARMPVSALLPSLAIAALAMLVAIITGIITHRKIFKDFFTFRPGKGQCSWLDAHTMLSVTTLPFLLMITYSGLILLASAYMPLIIAAAYGITVTLYYLPHLCLLPMPSIFFLDRLFDVSLIRCCIRFSDVAGCVHPYNSGSMR